MKLVKSKNFKKIQTIFDYDFVETLSLLGINEKFCVAASGGPDSLCLVLLANKFAKKNNLIMTVLTVDHGLRKESVEEAIWLGKILKKMKIKHYILRWNGKKPSSNIMDAARSKRYELMTNKCHKMKVNYLLTAHHLDDQIENFLMRLVQGSGLKGLSSMSKKTKINNIKILKPLLDYEKKSLIKFLAQNKQKYIEDSSNKDIGFDRIRHRKLVTGLIGEGLNKLKLNKLISNLNQVDDAINYSTIHSIKKTISQNKYGHIIIKKRVFFNLPKELQFRVLLFILKSNEDTKKRVRSESMLRLINIFNLKNFTKYTLNKSLFINQKYNILVVKEIGRISKKDFIKNKSFTWHSTYKIHMNTSSYNEFRIGFADNSFDKKFHFIKDKNLIEYMPAIWKKNQVISIPFLDKRKKPIATCISLKIEDFREFKILSN